MIPKVTAVEVAYGSLTNVARTISAQNAPGGSFEDQSTGVVAFVSMFCFFTRLHWTQSLYDNGFGAAVASIYQSRPESHNGTAEEKEQLLNTIMVRFQHEIRFQFVVISSLQEGYLAGLTEIMGSVSYNIIFSVQHIFR